MHDSVRKFVARSIKNLSPTKVLEVGSYDVNGSVRDLFQCDYTGVDLLEGPGVDLVLDAQMLSTAFEYETFDLVLCLEMLEHDSAPWHTAQELGLVLKPGGTLLVTVRGNGFPLHNEPDCWRFMKDGFKELLKLTECKIKKLTTDPEVSGWFAVCVKE